MLETHERSVIGDRRKKRSFCNTLCALSTEPQWSISNASPPNRLTIGKQRPTAMGLAMPTDQVPSTTLYLTLSSTQLRSGSRMHGRRQRATSSLLPPTCVLCACPLYVRWCGRFREGLWRWSATTCLGPVSPCVRRQSNLGEADECTARLVGAAIRLFTR